MNLSYICCTFDSVDEMHHAMNTLSMKGISAMEWDDYELWCEFDLTCCMPEDLTSLFNDPQLNID